MASVSIGGPYDAGGPGETSSRRKIFVCRPTGGKDSARGKDEDTCVKKILTTLARRAYRRPVTDGDVQILLRFYKAGRSKGGFETGIEMALQRILVDPEFLFRIERDPSNLAPGAAHRISDLELASRLSFFLWSSIPDDALLELAERGKLKDPAVLEQQVRRMLADSSSKALVDNFAGQWLYLRNMRLVAPDGEEFPDFDENLREAFRRETELFFESILREDRSVLDLLRANYTFVNERLSRHYGIPNVYGSRFRRVTLPDETRKGLVGQGSILTVTSYPNRTSPTLRGKWVLETILGAPRPDGRTAAGVQQSELDAGRVNHLAHDPAERVNLAHEMPLGDPADRRVAGHLRDQVEVHGAERRPQTHARRRHRRLAPRVPRADHDHIVLFIRSWHWISLR